MPTWLIIVLVALPVLFIVFFYNSIIRLRNAVKREEGRISIELQRRADLMTQVAKSVVAGSDKASGILKEITEARSGLINGAIAERFRNSQKADELMGKFFDSMGIGSGFSLNAQIEAYPDVKSITDLYDKLISEWRDTEDRIAGSKGSYNAVVMDFNNALQVFPSNIFASIFNFKPYESISMSEADLAEVKKVDKSDTEVKSIDEIQAESDQKKSDNKE